MAKKSNIDWESVGKVVGGFLLGTVGVKILASKDAKKVYTECTAAGLRAKEEILETTTRIRENADDILEDAKEINQKRRAEKDAAAAILGGDAPAGSIEATAASIAPEAPAASEVSVEVPAEA